MQGLLIADAKGAVSTRFSAIRCYSEPWRVACSPTKHRPQDGIAARLRAARRRGSVREASISAVIHDLPGVVFPSTAVMCP